MYSETRSENYFVAKRPKWFLCKEKAGGGIMMNYGAHTFDKIFSIFGVQDVDVVSSIANVKTDDNVEGQAQFIAKLADNTSAVATFSGYSMAAHDTFYYFRKGIVKVSGNCMVYDEKGIETEGDCSMYPEQPFLWQLEEFCKYINGEPSITPDGNFGRAVIKAIEEVYGKSN